VWRTTFKHSLGSGETGLHEWYPDPNKGLA